MGRRTVGTCQLKRASNSKNTKTHPKSRVRSGWGPPFFLKSNIQTEDCLVGWPVGRLACFEVRTLRLHRILLKDFQAGTSDTHGFGSKSIPPLGHSFWVFIFPVTKPGFLGFFRYPNFLIHSHIAIYHKTKAYRSLEN